MGMIVVLRRNGAHGAYGPEMRATCLASLFDALENASHALPDLRPVLYYDRAIAEIGSDPTTRRLLDGTSFPSKLIPEGGIFPARFEGRYSSVLHTDDLQFFSPGSVLELSLAFAHVSRSSDKSFALLSDQGSVSAPFSEYLLFAVNAKKWRTTRTALRGACLATRSSVRGKRVDDSTLLATVPKVVPLQALTVDLGPGSEPPVTSEWLEGFDQARIRVRSRMTSMPAPPFPASDRAIFSRVEMNDHSRLAALDDEAFLASLRTLSADECYRLFRRIAHLRLGLRSEFGISIRIETETNRAQFRLAKPLMQALKRIGKHLESGSETLGPELARSGRLFPSDDLVASPGSLGPYGFLRSAEIQELDRVIDRFLGIDLRAFRRREREKKQESGETIYHGLNPGFIFSSYVDVQAALSAVDLRPGESVIDLGSGIGRVGFVVGFLYSGSHFVGYEIDADRNALAASAAARHGLSNVSFIEQDLAKSTFNVPPADLYFAFDPVSESTFDKILRELRKNAVFRPFRLVLIESRSLLLRQLREQSWLKERPPAGIPPRFFIFQSLSARRSEDGV